MRPFDISGHIASVWKVKMRCEVPAEKTPCLCAYVFHYPSAHPFWSWYYAALVHLRDVPGVKPAYKLYPHAEYEFNLFALDPKHRPDIDKLESGEEHVHLLHPVNILEQFHGITDEQAADVINLAMHGIAQGVLNPDSDFRQHWRKVLINTIEHFATAGQHDKEV